MCEQKIYDFCKQNNVNNCKLLLAVSGGSDSVTLFHLFMKAKVDLGISEIGVVHINHGLRPKESDREEKFVSQLAQDEGCKLHMKRIKGKKQGDSGIEEWARDERYDFYAKIKRDFGYKFAATGHTADDQAETVLMRVSRGCGLTGLCGIPPVREDDIIRPLLQLRKKALRNWLKENKKSWHEDSSNIDLRYKRNRIRHLYIPVLIKREPKAVEHLALLAGQIRKQMDFLDPVINKWISDYVIESGPDCFLIYKTKENYDNFIAFEGVARIFRRYGIPFNKKDISNFLREGKRTSGCFLLKKGWRYYPAKDRVEIISKKAISKPKQKVVAHLLNVPGKTVCSDRGYSFQTAVFERDETFQYDTSNYTVFLDAEKTGEILEFRSIRKTDVFQPLGFKNHINVMSYLRKQKISNYYRYSMGVLAGKENKIVWIPGVAIDHKCRITYGTEKVFRISFQRIS
jgi:tRNA(Ile)-lysidine synthase